MANGQITWEQLITSNNDAHGARYKFEDLCRQLFAFEFLSKNKINKYLHPTFHLSMKCYLCSVISGSLTLIEHENAKWLNCDELYSVPWLPADLKVVEALIKSMIQLLHRFLFSRTLALLNFLRRNQIMKA